MAKAYICFIATQRAKFNFQKKKKKLGMGHHQCQKEAVLIVVKGLKVLFGTCQGMEKRKVLLNKSQTEQCSLLVNSLVPSKGGQNSLEKNSVYDVSK